MLIIRVLIFFDIYLIYIFNIFLTIITVLYIVIRNFSDICFNIST